MKIIFEYEEQKNTGYIQEEQEEKEDEEGKNDVSIELPSDIVRKELPIPNLNEIDVVRHYTNLSRMNFGVDIGFYPLGSCTMKYNPKVNEDAARTEGFSNLHPLSPEECVQGSLKLMWELKEYLKDITGMDDFSLQPSAGAQGELLGVMMTKAYFKHKGEKRNKAIIPDSAHGTNPATASMCRLETITVPSDARGNMDISRYKEALSAEVALVMLTNPNTLGLFDENTLEISELAHKNGTLMYCDGANMNALLGIARPGDQGFDIIHLNLHKTFSTPHGGGGPGAGVVGVKSFLADYLPVPRVVQRDRTYSLDYGSEKSVGRVRSFYGNFGMHVRAYSYIHSWGTRIRKVSEHAILNANYLQSLLKETFDLAYNRRCAHEFVLSSKRYGEKSAMQIAKRLMDYGFHPPTIYFPLIVPEALMIEPTETESKETLDGFVLALKKIATEIKEDPEMVKRSPLSTPVGRLDEVAAARRPNLRWHPFQRQNKVTMNENSP
ncbi:MAG: aminomethyl-transferring glycine dehydrogenase subunit GcvPB [Nitrososphaera sp.]